MLAAGVGPCPIAVVAAQALVLEAMGNERQSEDVAIHGTNAWMIDWERVRRRPVRFSCWGWKWTSMLQPTVPDDWLRVKNCERSSVPGARGRRGLHSAKS